MTADERDHHYLLASVKTRLVLACQLLLEARVDLECCEMPHDASHVQVALSKAVDSRDRVFKAIEEFVDRIVERDGDK